MDKCPIAIVETELGVREANTNDKNPIILQNISNLEFPIYIYNQENRFIDVNSSTLWAHRLDSPRDIISKNPFEIFKHRDALQLQNNNDMVLKNQKPLVFEESVELSHFTSIHALSFKVPLYSFKNILIGVFGLSILKLNPELFIQAIKKTGLASLAEKASSTINLVTIDNITLSKRQSECFRLLAQGKSAKQIAKLFDRNHRTIESHIEILKNKLSCCSTRDLIQKGFHFFIESKSKIYK